MHRDDNSDIDIAWTLNHARWDDSDPVGLSRRMLSSIPIF